MKKLLLLTALGLVSCGKLNVSSSNYLSGTGTIAKENTFEFTGYVLKLNNGVEYDVTHIDSQYQEDGLIVEFVGIPSSEIRPAGVPQKIAVEVIKAIGINN
jgi:hypothetical protein